MSSADPTGAVRVRWIAESLALSYGTARDGTRWRLRFDGALWTAEQLDGIWKSHGAHAEYRAAQSLAEQSARS